MSTVVVTAPEGETVSEVVAPVSEPATEAVAEAAVEIAEIEAGRDVAIAEIHAESERVQTEVIAEAVANEGEEERDEWQRNIENRLNSQEETNREILSTLQALTERLPPNQPEPVQDALEVTQESQGAPEPAPKPKARHHRLI